MKLGDFEYRNSSFFKHRFSLEFPGRYATIAETWDMGNQVLKYKYTSDFIFRSSNVRTNLEHNKINFEDFVQISLLSRFLKDEHVLMFPIQLSFFEKAWDWYVPSTPFEFSDTVIVSAAPKRIVTNSLSFLAMESQVITLTAITVIVLSSLLTLHWILNSRIRKRWSINMFKRLLPLLLRNVWNNTSVLCNEPIRRISPDITSRLISSTWLLGVTVILFFLNCFLKSECSIETYQTIDSLSDLIKSDVKPLIIEGTLAHENLRILANIDPTIKEWYSGVAKDQTNFCTLMDLLILEGYEDVISGKRALIINRTYLTWLIGEVLTGEHESKHKIADKGGLYISNGIRSDYLHIIYNRSYMTSSPELIEIGQVSVYPFFENKPFANLDFDFIYPIDYITWKKPIESTKVLKITSVSSPFYLLLMLILISATLVTFEIIL